MGQARNENQTQDVVRRDAYVISQLAKHSHSILISDLLQIDHSTSLPGPFQPRGEFIQMSRQDPIQKVLEVDGIGKGRVSGGSLDFPGVTVGEDDPAGGEVNLCCSRVLRR